MVGPAGGEEGPSSGMPAAWRAKSWGGGCGRRSGAGSPGRQLCRGSWQPPRRPGAAGRLNAGVQSAPSPPLPPAAAVPEGVPHQEEAGQEGQAEPPHPPLDPLQDQQHHPVRGRPPAVGLQQSVAGPATQFDKHAAFHSAARWGYSAGVEQQQNAGAPAAVRRGRSGTRPSACPLTPCPLSGSPPRCCPCRYNAKRRHWRRTKLGL